MAGRCTYVIPGFSSAEPLGSVSVYNAGTKVLATLYTDQTATKTSPNPVRPSGGGVVTFFAVDGDYDLSIPGSVGADFETVTVRDDPNQSVLLSGTVRLWAGSGTPASSLGANGDLYIDKARTGAKTISQKLAGTWTALV